MMHGGNLKLTEVPSTLSKLRKQVSFTEEHRVQLFSFVYLYPAFRKVENIVMVSNKHLDSLCASQFHSN